MCLPSQVGRSGLNRPRQILLTGAFSVMRFCLGRKFHDARSECRDDQAHAFAIRMNAVGLVEPGVGGDAVADPEEG